MSFKRTSSSPPFLLTSALVTTYLTQTIILGAMCQINNVFLRLSNYPLTRLLLNQYLTQFHVLQLSTMLKLKRNCMHPLTRLLLNQYLTQFHLLQLSTMLKLKRNCMHLPQMPLNYYQLLLRVVQCNRIKINFCGPQNGFQLPVDLNLNRPSLLCRSLVGQCSRNE